MALEKEMNRSTQSGRSKLPEFEIAGDAGKWGKFRIEAGWFSLIFAQRIRQAGLREMRETVGVYCGQEFDGALTIRVIVFNPDWDAPLQIARVVSRPDNPDELLTPVGFNLDHIALGDFK